MPLLQDWKVVADTEKGKVLTGIVHDHPNPYIEDGSFVMTSPQIKIDVKQGWAETMNNHYVLGMPHSDNRMANEEAVFGLIPLSV